MIRDEADNCNHPFSIFFFYILPNQKEWSNYRFSYTY